MTSQHNILAVDICGTLYKTNTSAGLVIFHHKRCANMWRHNILTHMSNRKSILYILMVIMAKATGFDIHRRIVLRSLKDQPNSALQDSAKIYVAQHLPDDEISPIHTRLKDMRAAGWQPILVSNALLPVVSEIGRQLGLPYLASVPKQHEGLLTGTLQNDLKGQKKQALEAHLGQSLSEVNLAVFTDNRSDIDLISEAEITVLVASGSPRKWMRRLNAEIICH